MKFRLDMLKFSNPVSSGNIKLFLRLCQEISDGYRVLKLPMLPLYIGGDGEFTGSTGLNSRFDYRFPHKQQNQQFGSSITSHKIGGFSLLCRFIDESFGQTQLRTS